MQGVLIQRWNKQSMGQNTKSRIRLVYTWRCSYEKGTFQINGMNEQKSRNELTGEHKTYVYFPNKVFEKLMTFQAEL